MTRTTEDSRYAQVNRLSSIRHTFIRTAAVRWLGRNHPGVLARLREEAYKRYPLLDKKVFRDKHDYSFIENVK